MQAGSPALKKRVGRSLAQGEAWFPRRHSFLDVDPPGWVNQQNPIKTCEVSQHLVNQRSTGIFEHLELCTAIQKSISAATVPKTKVSPENRPGPKRKGSSSNHQFSGCEL